MYRLCLEPELIALIALMVGNVLLSITAALAKRSFSFRSLGKVVPNRMLPLVGYLIVKELTEVVDEPNLLPVAITYYAGLVTLYVTGILSAIKSLTGLKIPDILSEK